VPVHISGFRGRQPTGDKVIKPVVGCSYHGYLSSFGLSLSLAVTGVLVSTDWLREQFVRGHCKMARASKSLVHCPTCCITLLADMC